jgi:hypothetical protein
MTELDVDSLAERYDECERAYLAVIREGGDRPTLVEVAAAVAEAAHHWESAAYRAFFNERERFGESARDAIQREIAAEQAEVLAGLWDDITAAHRGD